VRAEEVVFRVGNKFKMFGSGQAPAFAGFNRRKSGGSECKGRRASGGVEVAVRKSVTLFDGYKMKKTPVDQDSYSVALSSLGPITGYFTRTQKRNNFSKNK
jgi:hypothetical protein